MKMRPLGESGIQASVIGFGAWAAGGWTWGGADDQESIRAIHAFLDAGGNLVDTAPIYGFGHSEEVVGKAIAGRRDRVVLATKCTMRWDLTDAQKRRAKKKFSTNEKNIDESGKSSEKSFDVYIYSGRDGLFEEVERSLKRLGTDHIDLYQTHWQDDSTPIEERMGALEDLKRQGKIRAIGVSNATPEQIDDYKNSAESIPIRSNTPCSTAKWEKPTFPNASATASPSSPTARWPRACSPARSPPTANTLKATNAAASPASNPTT
jgi:methylglyoxal reductase